MIAHHFIRNKLTQLTVQFVSALLFGAVHLAGGLPYTLLATVAGAGYAYCYHLTKRIEAPIVLHIALNAVHFVGFTYPALR
jgi:hypothetical protein